MHVQLFLSMSRDDAARRLCRYHRAARHGAARRCNVVILPDCLVKGWFDVTMQPSVYKP